MKKSNSILAITVMAIMVAAVAIVSCKKEKQEQKNYTEQSVQTSANMDDYLIAFKEKLLSARKGEEMISIEQAQRDLGNLLNYDFGDANYATNVFQYDTLKGRVILNNDQIDFSELAVTYNEAVNQIIEAYDRVSLNEKSVYSIYCTIKNPSCDADDSVDVELILVTRGFDIGDTKYGTTSSWRPTNRGGTCDGSCIGILGAPEVIRNWLNADLSTLMCPNGRVYFTDNASSYVDAYQQALYDSNSPCFYQLYVYWGRPEYDCLAPSEVLYFYNQAVDIKNNKRYLFYPSIDSDHVIIAHSIELRYHEYYTNGTFALPHIWRLYVEHAKPNCTNDGPSY